MSLSIFDDKSLIPGNDDLSRVLADKYVVWNNIKSFVYEKYQDVSEEWNNSGKNYGWGFRLRDKKRVIVYMIPCSGFFKIGLVFGENATKEALNSTISKDVKTIIESAKVYGEGRGFRIDVRHKEILGDIKKLITIKLTNFSPH
jgi:hypothetical protein